MTEDEKAQHEAIEANLLELVDQGFMEMLGPDEDGNPLFRLTAAGRARVEAMIAQPHAES